MSLPRSHPVLKALAVCRRGSLQLRTPEGAAHVFTGDEPGPSADFALRAWPVLDVFLERGQTALALAYARGEWDSEDLPALLGYGLQNAPVLGRYFHGHLWNVFRAWLKNLLLDRNSIGAARRNILAHYDLGNDFYALWLDKSMTYSGAIFGGDPHRSLEEAQAAKYQRILDRLKLSPGAHVLEIGCGWGGFAESAAKKGLRVTAITISEAQKTYAVERIRRQKLDALVDILSIDYRQVSGGYDGIVSIGMFEHVGERYWRAYFETVKARLKPGGHALIQSICMDDDVFETLRGRSGFAENIIFPGGKFPSRRRFMAAAQQAGLACDDLFAFGPDYALTVREWLRRFDANREAIRALGFDDFFMRLWRFYFASSIAAFESKRSGVMQANLRHG